MPLVNAKCTNCGANLQVDNTKDAAICQYCGSAYIVEKAINNYNTVNHIHANVVNIYGGNSVDFVIRGGVLEKYNGTSTHVVIPNSVSYIGKGAFENCYALKSVTIPDSVTTIGWLAFKNCWDLETIIIPHSVIHIHPYAFMGCKNLKIMNLPNSIEDIGDSAFEDCTSLEKITLPTKLSEFSACVFKNCTSLSTIVIPKGTVFQEVARDAYGTFAGCSSLVNVIAEDENTELPLLAFAGTPWLQQRYREHEKKERELIEEKRRNWRKKGKCDLCGGSFSGLISKKCSTCGNIKRY